MKIVKIFIIVLGFLFTKVLLVVLGLILLFKKN